tara:strand:- start:46 stop:516 length:471 start_codon:yes stop_codon:yes gene_type:complete
MNRIWAPWRKSYVAKKKNKGCIFCQARKDKASDKKRYVLKRTDHSFSILNLYPYNNAHVMVAPNRHVKTLELLNDVELLDLFKLVNGTKLKIDKFLKPAGYNIGLNVGRVAGAGFPGHTHIHVVPRWRGDANFMPIIGNAKIISYSLDDMWKMLRR